MRTKTLLIAAAALAVGVASSLAQTYSQNVVGYVNRVIPAYPGYAAVANPLDSGNNVLTNLLQSLPVGAKVIKYNPAHLAFDLQFARNGIGAGWSPTGSGTNTLQPWEGCIVQLNTANVNGFTNTFVGNVLQGSMTNVMAPGYTFMSFPVAIGGAVTNPAINLNAYLPATPSNSKLIMYNEALQNGWTLSFTRNAIGAGWSPSVPSLTPGVAFLILNNGTTNRNWIINYTVQ